MANNRNNLLAGILVTAAIIGSVIAIIVLAGGAEQLGRHSYVVNFDLATGVSGLTPGAEVSIGGKKVGAVQSAEFVETNGAISSVDVTIGISRSIVLLDGAKPVLELPLLGSQSSINFPTIGDGKPLPAGTRLTGSIAPPSFLAQAGYGEDEKARLQNILKNADDAVANFKTTSDRAVSIADDASQKWPTWSSRIDSITKKADDTLDRAPKIADDIQARVDQIEKLLSTAQGYLDENRENVKAAITEFRNIGEKGSAFADRLNGELKDAALALLEKGKSTLDDARVFVQRADSIVKENRPTIRRVMADIRLAADQLRDTLIEVRRSPWRLIYRPDTRELNFELLYDSARAYATSVSDLRAASESLEALMSSGPDPQLLREGSVNDLLTTLQSSMDNYKKAEQRFMDQLLAVPHPTTDDDK